MWHQRSYTSGFPRQPKKSWILWLHKGCLTWKFMPPLLWGMQREWHKWSTPKKKSASFILFCKQFTGKTLAWNSTFTSSPQCFLLKIFPRICFLGKFYAVACFRNINSHFISGHGLRHSWGRKLVTLFLQTATPFCDRGLFGVGNEGPRHARWNG